MRKIYKMGRIKVPTIRSQEYKTPEIQRKRNKAYKLRQAKVGNKFRGIYANDELWSLMQALKSAYVAGNSFTYYSGKYPNSGDVAFIRNPQIGE